jgi:hypothetical protein
MTKDFNISHTKHIMAGSHAEMKNLTPPQPFKHKPWLAEFTGALQTFNFPGGAIVLLYIFFIFILFYFILLTGHPDYQPLPCSDK